MKGIAKIVSAIILVAFILVMLSTFTLWFKGIVGQYMKDTSVKLYIIPLKVFDNGTIEFYIRNYGRNIVVDSIFINGKYQLEPYKVEELNKLSSKAVISSDGLILIPEGADLKLLAEVNDLKLRAGNVYELIIHTVDGGLYITNVKIYSVIKVSSNNVNKFPWLCKNLKHRVVLNVTSDYDRTNYPIPIRLNLTKLGFKEYLNESTIKVLLKNGEELTYSITRIANNTYWLVVNTSLIANDPVTLELYFNTTNIPNTLGKHFGDLGYVFPLPCGYSALGNDYEIEHLQIDSSNYSYVLLMGTYPVFNDGKLTITHDFKIDDVYYFTDSLGFSVPFYGVQYKTSYVVNFFHLYLGKYEKESIGTSAVVPENEFTPRKVIASGWTYQPAFTDSSIILSIMSGLSHGVKFKEYLWKCTSLLGNLVSKVWIAESGDIQMNIYGSIGYVVAGLSNGNGKWLAFLASDKFDDPEFFSKTVSTVKVTYSLNKANICNVQSINGLKKYYFMIINLDTLKWYIVTYS